MQSDKPVKPRIFFRNDVLDIHSQIDTLRDHFIAMIERRIAEFKDSSKLPSESLLPPSEGFKQKEKISLAFKASLDEPDSSGKQQLATEPIQAPQVNLPLFIALAVGRKYFSLIPANVEDLDLDRLIRLLDQLSAGCSVRVSKIIGEVLEYFVAYIIPTLQLSAQQLGLYVEPLKKKCLEVIRSALFNRLCDVLVAKALETPSIEQTYLAGNKTESRDNLVIDDEDTTCVAPERSYIILSRLQQGKVLYGGFAGLVTCIGLMLRHVPSGKMAFVHLSGETPLEPTFDAIFQEFDKEILSDKDFEVRLMGGMKDWEESHFLFRNILLYLLSYSCTNQLVFKLISVNCFDNLIQYRQIHGGQIGNDTVGFLLDREGRAILFKQPLENALTPCTDIGKAVFAVGPARLKHVWFNLLRALNLVNENELTKIYDDTIADFITEFRKICEKQFRRQCILILLKELQKLKLVKDDKDVFVFNLIDHRINIWAKTYQIVFKSSEENTCFSDHLINYFVWQTYDTVYKNLIPMPFSQDKIRQLFLKVIIHDDCLKMILYDSVAKRCEALLRDAPKGRSACEGLIEFSSVNIESPWHIIDEIVKYQRDLRAAAFPQPENLICMLLRCGSLEEVKAQFANWQKQMLAAAISQNILDKVIGKCKKGVDVELINLIREYLEGKGVKLLQCLHEHSHYQPNVSQLIDELAEKLDSGNKWATCFPVNLSAELRKAVDKWWQSVKIIPLVSRLNEGKRDEMGESEQCGIS
jgi:hypothetical protein